MDDDGGALDFFIWENQEWTIPISEKPEENPGDHQRCAGSGGGGSESHRAPPPSAGRKRCQADNDDDGDGGVSNGISGVLVESDHEVHIWTERERRKKMRDMFSNLHALLPQLPPKADKSTIVDEAVSYIKTLQHTLHKLQKRKMEMLHGFISSPAAAAPSSSLIPSSHKTAAKTNPPPAAFLPHDHQHPGAGGLLASLIGSLSTPPPHNRYPEPAVARHPAASSFQTWTSPNVVLNVCGGDAQISLCCAKEAAAASCAGGSLLTEVGFVLEKHKIEVLSAQVSSDRRRSMVMIQARSGSGWLFDSETTSCATAAAAEEIYKRAAAEIMAWITSHAGMHAM